MNAHTPIMPSANSKAIRDHVAGLECNLAIIADLLGCIAELADKHYDPGAIVTLVLLAERECSESRKAQSELFTLTRPAHSTPSVTATKPGAFAKAASGYHDALAALNAHDGDDKELQRLSAAFDTIRDRVFAFRPSTMEEVAQKATFLAAHYDDAEGLNPERLRQLLVSMGAPA